MPTPGHDPDHATGVTRFHVSTYIPRTHPRVAKCAETWMPRMYVVTVHCPTTCGVDQIFDRAKEGAGSDERRSGWRGGLA
jgi:hypothetical protein